MLSDDNELYVRDIDQIKINIFHIWDIRAASEKQLQTYVDLLEKLDSEWSMSVEVCVVLLISTLFIRIDIWLTNIEYFPSTIENK